MYRVLIVDDEKPLLDSMKQFEWERYNCRCVGAADNGETALLLCRRLMPHIVITDINMPVMNGLMLLQHLQRELPNVRVILLTVYRDFAYAQEALRYGAVDYLVKDMNLRQRLPEALTRACAAFENRESAGRRADFLRCGRRLLVAEEADADERAAFFARYQGTLATARPARPREERFALLDALSGAEEGMGLLCFDGGFELLLSRPLSQAAGRVETLLRQHASEESMALALSGPVRDEESYIACHARNMMALEAGFYAPLPLCMRAGDVCFAPLPNALCEQWMRALTQLGLDKEAVCDYIESEIVPDIRANRYAPEAVRSVFERLLHRFEADYARGADMRAHAGLRDCATLSQAQGIICGAVRQVAQEQPGYGYLVDEAIAYMAAHLHDGSLALPEVAQNVHISPGYLSKKLKDATGMTFQEQLIRMRMERAAALLRRGDLKVYEVAEQLGYQNYRSFSSAFERQYHVSPKKYRG